MAAIAKQVCESHRYIQAHGCTPRYQPVHTAVHLLEYPAKIKIIIISFSHRKDRR